MDEIINLRLTAFQYAIKILKNPEISMHIKSKSLDVFELANKINSYLMHGE